MNYQNKILGRRPVSNSGQRSADLHPGGRDYPHVEGVDHVGHAAQLSSTPKPLGCGLRPGSGLSKPTSSSSAILPSCAPPPTASSSPLGGMTINMLLTVPLAYALSNRDLPGRKFFIIMVMIPFLFNAGSDPHLPGGAKTRPDRYLLGGDLARRHQHL